MQLQGKQTIGPPSFRVIVSQLRRLHAVDVVNKVKSLCGYPVSIPIPLLDRLADLLGVTELLCLLLQLPLIIQGQRGVESPIRKNAAKSFSVANT